MNTAMRCRSGTSWLAALLAIALGSTADAQPPVDWVALGANAATIVNTGQTFTDIGTTLGRPDLVGVDLTLSYSGTGLSGTKLIINDNSLTDDRWNLFNGTLSFAFSSSVEVRFEGGGSILSQEVDSFGPAGIGSLISTHPEVGLTVTDDSVGNLTSGHIVTNSLVWLGDLGTSFSHSVASQNQGASLFILVPEPSTLLLVALGGLGVCCFMRRRSPGP